MGFTPQEVDQMSLWQFAAAVDGWNSAHGAEPMPDPPSAEEFHDMVQRLS